MLWEGKALVTRDRLMSCCSSPSLQLNYYRSSSRHCQRATRLIIMQIHQQLRNTHTHRLTSAHTSTVTDGIIHCTWGSNRRMIMVIYVWKSECHGRHIHSCKAVMKQGEQGMDIECVLSIKMKLQCGRWRWLHVWAQIIHVSRILSVCG